MSRLPTACRVRMARLRARAGAAQAALWRATDGVAAVEFALVLPIMVTLFLGMSEVTLAVNIDRKLTLLSRSLADLASRAQALSTSDMSGIFGAAGAIMRPFTSPSAQMVLSSVTVTQSGSTYTGSIAWSCGMNLSTTATTSTQNDPTKLQARTVGSSYTVPTAFQSSTTKSFLVAETLVPYRPMFGYIATGTIYLRENTPWPVRDTDSVTGPGTCPTS